MSKVEGNPAGTRTTSFSSPPCLRVLMHTKEAGQDAQGHPQLLPSDSEALPAPGCAVTRLPTRRDEQRGHAGTTGPSHTPQSPERGLQ